MPSKRIEVRSGILYIRWPDDANKFAKMCKKIEKYLSEANKKITPKNEKEIDREFREKARNVFEDFFGKGSCLKTFGTDLPGYKGYTEFICRFDSLTKNW